MAKKPKPKAPLTDYKQSAADFKKEGPAYDKIFKEIAGDNFLPLAEEKLGVKFVKCVPLQEAIQITPEFEVDFLYRVTDEHGAVFLLHLEFQSADDPEMIARMAEYHGLIFKKYQQPISHVVIYFGAKKSAMQTRLQPEQVFIGFDLIDVSLLDPNAFLSSQLPGLVLLAIFADYPKEQTEATLRLVYSKLRKLSNSRRVFAQYINRLIMLSRLRNIQDLTIKIKEEMPYAVSIEKDPFLLKESKKEWKKESKKVNWKKPISL